VRQKSGEINKAKVNLEKINGTHKNDPEQQRKYTVLPCFGNNRRLPEEAYRVITNSCMSRDPKTARMEESLKNDVSHN
jgi:hypothetical protein